MKSNLFIKSSAVLFIAIIASFFVFAISGMAQAALVSGILSVSALFIKSVEVALRKNDPIFSPSRSRRIKSHRARIA